MRRVLLTVTLLASPALAGGAGPRPANAPVPIAPVTTKAASHTLPANALVQIGQIWVVDGITADKQTVHEELTVDKISPEEIEGYESWIFDILGEKGALALSNDQRLLIVRITDLETKKIKFCETEIKGKGITGVLFSDSDKIWGALTDDDMKTVSQLQKFLRKVGIPFGSCTLKRK